MVGRIYHVGLTVSDWDQSMLNYRVKMEHRSTKDDF